MSVELDPNDNKGLFSMISELEVLSLPDEFHLCFVANDIIKKISKQHMIMLTDMHVYH